MLNTFSLMLGGPLPGAGWFQLLQGFGVGSNFIAAAIFCSAIRRVWRLGG
jgi:hypothetical protein